MRTAIVHDWLDTWGGGENVLAELLQIYPHADLFTVVDFFPDDYRRRLNGARAQTSFIQHLPFARGHFRKYFPLMPRAVESFDLSRYDLVISSSHAVAKGARTSANQLHICLCYSPARYAWDLREQYLEQMGLDRGPIAWLARKQLERFRRWDLRSSARADRFVAISETIAQRIRASYGREAEVIYPPVDVAGLLAVAQRQRPAQRECFYLTVSRLVPYKRVDLIVEAFTAMPERQLVVAGSGPELARITKRAGSNVRLLGQIDDAQRNHLLATARAFVFAAEEDFGIAPLEAQACGTPVIAFGRGGSLETIRGLDAAQPTGVFFSVQSAPAIRAAVEEFERSAARISDDACRENAQRFSADVFRERFTAYVDQQMVAFRNARRLES
jgi:glycosyltransferase involved in cell wall biosynthesis